MNFAFCDKLPDKSHAPINSNENIVVKVVEIGKTKARSTTHVLLKISIFDRRLLKTSCKGLFKYIFLNIQIPNQQCIRLNKGPTTLHIIAH